MGFENITLSIVDANGNSTGKTYTCITEHSGYINSILGDFVTSKGTVTEEQVNVLKNTANGNGKDTNVIEKCELGDFFQKVADTDYYDYYDIIQKNNNTYVRIKKTGMLHPDPKAQNIVNDFNLQPGVLLNHNRELLESRYEYTNPQDSSYNHAELEAGDIIEIPGTPKLDKSACGWFLRLFTTH